MLLVKVAFSGKMTAGKTTISELIVSNDARYKRMAIGDGIKDVSKLILEDLDELENRVKNFNNWELYMERMVRLNKENRDKNFQFNDKGEFIKNDLYRPYVQLVGRLSREYFGESIWMDLYIEKVSKESKWVICDDVRSMHEYKSLKDSGCVIIRLDVEQEEQVKRMLNLYGSYEPGSMEDVTETALDNEVFDFRFDTTSDAINVTYEKVAKTLKIS